MVHDHDPYLGEATTVCTQFALLHFYNREPVANEQPTYQARATSSSGGSASFPPSIPSLSILLLSLLYSHSAEHDTHWVFVGASQDIPLVRGILEDIERMLQKHEGLDPRQHRLTFLDRFDEHSAVIWVSCYTKTVFLSEYRKTQQDILFEMYDIIMRNGARLTSDLHRFQGKCYDCDQTTR